MDQTTNFEEVMKERFAKLPPSVQNAITSADVETHLRELAKSHQLHIDQWDLLENEVMLTLLGLQQMSQLKENIATEVGVPDEVAAMLANDISQYIFQPIREELERQLEHPDARATKVSDVDTMRTQVLSNEITPSSSLNTVAATPAMPAPQEKTVRAPASTTYLSQTPSHERKTIEGDPYREQVD